MKSLAYLNNYSASPIEVLDERAANVTLDTAISAIQEQKTTYNNSAVPMPFPFAVEEIINWQTSDLTLTLTRVSNDAGLASNTSVVWANLAPSLTVANQGNDIIVTGFKTAVEFNQLNPTILFPATYASATLLFIKFTIKWFDQAAGVFRRVVYDYYDRNYYYTSDPTGVFSVTATGRARRTFSANITCSSTMLADPFDVKSNMTVSAVMTTEPIELLNGAAAISSTVNSTVSIRRIRAGVSGMTSTSTMTSTGRMFKAGVSNPVAAFTMNADNFAQYLAIASSPSSGTTYSGYNYYKLQDDQATLLPITSWSGQNNGSYASRGDISLGLGASAMLTTEQSDIPDLTKLYLTKVLRNNDSPSISTPVLIDSAVAAGAAPSVRATRNNEFIAVQAGNYLKLFNGSTLTELQNITFVPAGQALGYVDMSWDNTGTYLIASYNEIIQGNTRDPNKIRFYKRSGNALSLLTEQTVNTDSVNSVATYSFYARHTQSPTGKFVYVSGGRNTKVVDGTTVQGDNSWISYYSRTNDTYSYVNRFSVVNSLGVRSLAVSKDGLFLALSATHNNTPTNPGYILIYSINQTTGAPTLVTSIRQPMSPLSTPYVYRLAWSDIGDYLAFGSMRDNTNNGDGNVPLFIWKKVGSSMVSVPIDSLTYAWPTATTAGKNIIGDLAFRSV